MSSLSLVNRARLREVFAAARRRRHSTGISSSQRSGLRAERRGLGSGESRRPSWSLAQARVGAFLVFAIGCMEPCFAQGAEQPGDNHALTLTATISFPPTLDAGYHPPCADPSISPGCDLFQYFFFKEGTYAGYDHYDDRVEVGFGEEFFGAGLFGGWCNLQPFAPMIVAAVVWPYREDGRIVAYFFLDDGRLVVAAMTAPEAGNVLRVTDLEATSGFGQKNDLSALQPHAEQISAALIFPPPQWIFPPLLGPEAYFFLETGHYVKFNPETGAAVVIEIGGEGDFFWTFFAPHKTKIVAATTVAAPLDPQHEGLTADFYLDDGTFYRWKYVAGFPVSGPHDPIDFQTRVCNGMAGLCDVPFDKVTFPGSHNAGAGYRTHRDQGLMYYWSGFEAFNAFSRNQYSSLTEQLEDGARFFDIDTMWVPPADYVGTWWEPGGAWTGHGNAYAGPVREVVQQIHNWLITPNNRNEVVIIHFGNNIYDVKNYADEIYANQNCGIKKILEEFWPPNGPEGALKMYEQMPNSPGTNPTWTWPTLGEMIQSNRRIVVFMNHQLFGTQNQGDCWSTEAHPDYKLPCYIHDDHYMSNTYKERAGTSSCSAILENITETNCDPEHRFVKVEAVLAFGLYLNDLADLCDGFYTRESALLCEHYRLPGATVNFVTADCVGCPSIETPISKTTDKINLRNIQRFTIDSTPPTLEPCPCQGVQGPFLDCNNNMRPDACELLADCDLNPIDCMNEKDCNGNEVPDDCEPEFIIDCDGDSLHDACQSQIEDCDGNGVPDTCELFFDLDLDLDQNGVLDVCDPDCNHNEIPDCFDILNETSNDLNSDGVPDECPTEIDSDGAGAAADPRSGQAGQTGRRVTVPITSQVDLPIHFRAPPPQEPANEGDTVVNRRRREGQLTLNTADAHRVEVDEAGLYLFSTRPYDGGARGLWVDPEDPENEDVRDIRFHLFHPLTGAPIPDQSTDVANASVVLLAKGKYLLVVTLMGDLVGDGDDLYTYTMVYRRMTGPVFLRGDADASGFVTGADALLIDTYKTLGDVTLPCMDAADANDDGEIGLLDSAYIRNFLLGGPPPPAPGPSICSPDPTFDGFNPTFASLGCESYPVERCVTYMMDTVPFIRGDSNEDGALDISDPISELGFLFQGGPAPDCIEGLDANSDRAIDISDAIFLLAFLFGPGPPPIQPIPCGPGNEPRNFPCDAPPVPCLSDDP